MKNLSIVVLAPAKINLSLAITDKRTNGYHGLETVFQSVSLSDQVEVKISDQGITCICGEISGRDNLAYQAAQSFLTRYKMLDRSANTAGVEITIDKKIPVQAGLGGGSSDAAAVLRAMNTLFSNPFSYEELLRCANQCGSDTAFCLQGGTQWGTGTGTELTVLPPAPEMDLILVKPSSGVSTAQAYRIFDNIGEYKTLDKKRWVELLNTKDIVGIGESLSNSLESSAIKLLPEIQWIKEQLLEGGCYGALMSGSGSSVFGILKDPIQGLEIVKRFANKANYQTWVIKTVREAHLFT